MDSESDLPCWSTRNRMVFGFITFYPYVRSNLLVIRIVLRVVYILYDYIYNHMKHTTYRNQENRKMKNRTKRKVPEIIHGKIIEKKEGWIIAEIHGTAYDRGFAHGVLLNQELARVKECLPFLVKKWMAPVSFDAYIKTSNRVIKPCIKKYHPEFFQEIWGISDGASKAGLDISVNLIIAWNAYMSLYSYLKEGPKRERCSAFIATGNATKDGKIVMAHNSHCDMLSGQLANIVLYVDPQKGHKFVMQTSPGLICSVTDWFICSSGIIGCETTIGGISYKPKFGSPFFCRIRQAMQYGNTLDDYAKIMLKNNAGDYACSWQFGNINTNEIMLFEIGLKTHSIRRTKDGIYYGMNAAIDANIREKETNDKDLLDISTSSGSRSVRLDYLLNKQYYGKIDKEIAKIIIADHYDMFLNKPIRNGVSICCHNEFDIDTKHKNTTELFCATDGKVVDASMAKKLEFDAIFGSSCGRTFSMKKFVKKYPHYEEWGKYMKDVPSYSWIKIGGTGGSTLPPPHLS